MMMRWLRERFGGKHFRTKSVGFSRWSIAQAMVEYAMVLALVAVAVYAAYTATGKDVSALVNKTDKSITAS
jgi:Flp pilus assembly pilin Flp